MISDENNLRNESEITFPVSDSQWKKITAELKAMGIDTSKGLPASLQALIPNQEPLLEQKTVIGKECVKQNPPEAKVEVYQASSHQYNKSLAQSVQHFALVCSGANLAILDAEDGKVSEKTKYAMIGIFIFLTSVFAALSGGYALYTGFQSIPLVVCMGLLWGIFVFTIDRFIISTMRKKQFVADQPWHQKLAHYGSVALRLALTVLLSIVIGTPLELKYFEREIDAQISEQIREEKTRTDSQPAQNHLEIDRLENENRNWQQVIAEKEKECKALQDRYLKEMEGKGGTFTYGDGPVAKVMREQYEKCNTKLIDISQDITAKINGNQAEIAALREGDNLKKQKLNDTRETSIGFLARFDAMNKLVEKSSSMWFAKLYISLLILMLGCTPILMKMLANYTLYDSYLEKEEYFIYLNMQKAISEENLQTNMNLYINERMAALLVTVEEQVMKETISGVSKPNKPEIEKTEQAIRKKVIEDLRIHLDEFAPVAAPKNGTKDANNHD